MPPHVPRRVCAEIPLVPNWSFRCLYAQWARAIRLHTGRLTFIEPQHVSHQVYTVIGIDQHSKIPPRNGRSSSRRADSGIPAQGELLAIIPHMHLRGKAFQLERSVRQPDGSGTQREILLNVPHYDFNWQHTYELASPIRLDQTNRCNSRPVFDNSRANPFNPDPDQTSHGGDQTWEEMAVVFLEMAVSPGDNDTTVADSTRWQSLQHPRQQLPPNGRRQ